MWKPKRILYLALAAVVSGCTDRDPFLFVEVPVHVALFLAEGSSRNSEGIVSEEERESARREALEKAKSGDSEAQFMAAINATDSDKGWMWMCRSAMQNHPYAQMEIARWYDSNVEDLFWQAPIRHPDKIKAHFWYSLPVSNGHPDSLLLRDRVAETLTPDQIAEAERLVAEWKPDPAWCEKAVGDAVAAEPH